jgi:hypothetical protein
MDSGEFLMAVFVIGIGALFYVLVIKLWPETPTQFRPMPRPYPIYKLRSNWKARGRSHRAIRLLPFAAIGALFFVYTAMYAVRALSFIDQRVFLAALALLFIFVVLLVLKRVSPRN